MRATQKYLEVKFVSNACIFVSVCDCDCDCTQQSLDAFWSRVRSPRERRAASSVAASSAATPALATCCRYICGSRCCCCCCCCHKRKTECMTNVRLARGCSSNEATRLWRVYLADTRYMACLPVLAWPAWPWSNLYVCQLAGKLSDGRDWHFKRGDKFQAKRQTLSTFGFGLSNARL